MSQQPDKPRGPLAFLRGLADAFIHRAHEERTEGKIDHEQPTEVPAELVWDGVPLQMPGDGYGPLFHRRYQVDIASPRQSAQQLMNAIQADLSAFAPQELAEFVKVRGRPGSLAVGDEYDIKILGPWNGSVRVVDVSPGSFALVTLQGHPEAGQIRFSLENHPQQSGALRFAIRSWARSRDMLVSLTYNEGKLGREIQKNAWLTFCERVVEVSGGQMIGEISVVTEKREFSGEVVPIE